MEVSMTINKFIRILARTIDHRIGKTDDEKPELPILTVNEALVSFFIRLLIVLINFVTCGFVIANIIRHW